MGVKGGRRDEGHDVGLGVGQDIDNTRAQGQGRARVLDGGDQLRQA